MADDTLLSELKDGVLTLTLNRPKANAFNTELTQTLTRAIKDAGRNDEVRCVLLVAGGKIFSAGQDVGEFGQGAHVSFRAHLLRTYNPLIKQMRALEKPILAAAQGATAGAALGVLMACDLRIAAEDAKFFVGFSGIGLAPDSAVSLMLPALIGLGRAAEAAYFNQPIAAQQALDWGLVNAVVPAEELRATAMQWAAKLATGPTEAIGLTKRDFNRAVLPNLDEVLDYEAHNQEIAGRGRDHAEGLAAFVEKRDPDYVKASKKE